MFAKVELRSVMHGDCGGSNVAYRDGALDEDLLMQQNSLKEARKMLNI